MIRRIAIFLAVFIPAAMLVIILAAVGRPVTAATESAPLSPVDMERLHRLEIEVDKKDPATIEPFGDIFYGQDIVRPQVNYYDLKTRRARIIVRAERYRPNPKNPKYSELIEPKVTYFASPGGNAAAEVTTDVTAGLAQVFNNGTYFQVELEGDVTAISRSADNGNLLGNPQVLKTELLWVLQHQSEGVDAVPRRRIITDRPISIEHNYYSVRAQGLDESSITGVTALAGPVDATMESRVLKRRLKPGDGRQVAGSAKDPYWMEIHCDKGARIKSRFITRQVAVPGKPASKIVERVPESMRFYNKVRLVRMGQIITANDRLIVNYPVMSDPGALRPKTIIAEGGVVAEQDYQVVGEGERAVFEPLDNKFTLFGNPAVLRYGSDTLHSPVIKVRRISDDRFEVDLKNGVEGIIRSGPGRTGWRLKARNLKSIFDIVPENDPSIADIVSDLGSFRDARKAVDKNEPAPARREPDPSKKVPVLLSLDSMDEPLHLYGDAGQVISGSSLRFDRKTGLLVFTGDSHHRPYFRGGDDFFAAGDRVEVNLRETAKTSVHALGHVSGRTVRRMLPAREAGKTAGKEENLEPNLWEFSAEEGWFHFARRGLDEESGKPEYIPSKIRLSGRGNDFSLRETGNPRRTELITISGGELDLDLLASGGNGSGTVLPRPGSRVKFSAGKQFNFEAEKVVYNGAAGTVAFEEGGIGRLFPRKKTGREGVPESEPWNVVFARLLIEVDEVENITAWTAYPLPGRQVDISRPGVVIRGDRLRYEPPKRLATFSGNIRGRIEQPQKHAKPGAPEVAYIHGAWNFTASNLLASLDENEDALESITVRDGVNFFADPGPHGERAEFKSDTAVYSTAIPKLSFTRGRNRPHMKLEVYSEELSKVMPNELRADRFELFPTPGLLLARGDVSGDFFIAGKNRSAPTRLRFNAPKMALRLRQEALVLCGKCGKWSRMESVIVQSGMCASGACPAAIPRDAKKKNSWRIDEIFAFDGIKFSSVEAGGEKPDYEAGAASAIYESDRGTVSLRGEPAWVVMQGQGRVTQRDMLYDTAKHRIFLHNPDYIYPWKSDPSETGKLRKAFEEPDSEKEPK